MAPQPPVPVTVRSVRSQDADQLHRLRGEADAIAYTLALPSERDADTRKFLDNLGPDDHIFVAEIEERVVGVIGLHVRSGKQRHSASLGMSVADQFQGRGVGRLLLDTALELADDHLGLLRVDLEVVADNTRAIRLYEHAGFELEGRRRNAFQRRGGLADILLYGRFLSSSPAGSATADPGPGWRDTAP